MRLRITTHSGCSFAICLRCWNHSPDHLFIVLGFVPINKSSYKILVVFIFIFCLFAFLAIFINLSFLCTVQFNANRSLESAEKGTFCPNQNIFLEKKCSEKEKKVIYKRAIFVLKTQRLRTQIDKNHFAWINFLWKQVCTNSAVELW